MGRQAGFKCSPDQIARMREGRRLARERKRLEASQQLQHEQQIENYHKGLRVVVPHETVDPHSEAMDLCKRILSELKDRGKLYEVFQLLIWARNNL